VDQVYSCLSVENVYYYEVLAHFFLDILLEVFFRRPCVLLTDIIMYI
jgi:hypothetical protein